MRRTLAAPHLTLADRGAATLSGLCRMLGYPLQEERTALEVFRAMAQPWGRALPGSPRWPSDITDDHTPFEFSVAIHDGVPEIRFLLEVQGEAPLIVAHWEAARTMNARLAAEFGVALDRLEAVEDLFTPTAACPRFAMWHAVCFPLGAPPAFKAYLNPQARGGPSARGLVEVALDRLGLGEARMPALAPGDERYYMSLDLSSQRMARVKVYTAHHDATADQIEAAVAGASGQVEGRAADFCVAMGGYAGRYHGRPVLTCLSFVEGIVTPTTGTVHFPVRAYADHDATIRDRVMAYLDADDAAIYRRALEAFADRRLEDGVGMQTYASLRQEQGRRRLTVYLAPEVYQAGHNAMSQDGSGMIERTDHPRGPLLAAEDENA